MSIITIESNDEADHEEGNWKAPEETSFVPVPEATASMPTSNYAQMSARVPPVPLPFSRYNPTKYIRPNNENTLEYIDDILTCGVHYLHCLRTRGDLSLHDDLKKLLIDPLPGVARPFAICDADNIPQQMYDYFWTLTFQSNKTIPAACIWIDLCEYSPTLPFTED